MGPIGIINEWGTRRPLGFALLAALINTVIFGLVLDLGDSRSLWLLLVIFVFTLAAAYVGRLIARSRKRSLGEDFRRYWRAFNK